MNYTTPVTTAQKIDSSPRMNADNDDNKQADGEGSVATIPVTQLPKMFKVIVLNDDFTPMDFVVLVLRRFFGKNEEEATKVMLDVHRKGAGVAGLFTLEIAEMKVMQVNQFSQMNHHPLKSTLEEE